MTNVDTYWDERKRESVVPERKGSSHMIPAILRVPLPSKHKRADNDPKYLSRGGRGRKMALLHEHDDASV